MKGCDHSGDVGLKEGIHMRSRRIDPVISNNGSFVNDDPEEFRRRLGGEDILTYRTLRIGTLYSMSELT